MRLPMMLIPYSSLMRLSLYQTMYSSSILVNPSMVTPLKLRRVKGQKVCPESRIFTD